VELYKFCVSLQNTFFHDLSAIFAGGRSIGVTNKTISRWENGNYMPDVEMLSLLSKEFGVSINELISGERLWAEDFKKAADDNLVTALNNSTFTLKEKIVFFKKKWLHEHISTIVLCVVAWIGIIIWTALKLRGSDSYALLGAIGSMLAILFYVVLYNRMMVYVENHAYRATPDKETETKN
jgi:transcriptional regulator with XRE-family HTH domain